MLPADLTGEDLWGRGAHAIWPELPTLVSNVARNPDNDVKPNDRLYDNLQAAAIEKGFDPAGKDPLVKFLATSSRKVQLEIEAKAELPSRLEKVAPENRKGRIALWQAINAQAGPRGEAQVEGDILGPVGGLLATSFRG